jgi:hypothetical protein
MYKVGHGRFWVEPIFNTATAYSKIMLASKGGRKQLKNNALY